MFTQIVEYDACGQQLRTDSSHRDYNTELSGPYHMFLDVDNKYILVADRYNCCILLFTSQLRFQGVVLSSDKLNATRPLRLCYIQQTGQLFVGLSHGYVNVYNVCY